MRDLKYIKILLATAAICLLTTGCRTKEIDGSAAFFDTVIRIEIQGRDDQELIDQCLELCRKYEKLFSKTVEGSDIDRINRAGGASVAVSEETVFLLEKAIHYSELSDGRFDITIAPVSSLWQFENNPDGTLPSEEAIQEAVSHVDWHCIQIDGAEVTLTDPAAQLDLGGIAKGYIADQLKKYLQSEGVEHAILNLGGNILTIGSRTDGKDFRIGIQKPFDEQGASIATVEVNDQSVVSSGVYERCFEKNGTLYHHILDPATGYPYENNLLSVTIISDTSVDGDALSTTCFALGLTDGMDLIHSMDDGTRAIFITDDETLHYSWKE